MTHILALIVGLGSLAIYLAAFFFPEVHRKNDFYLSGVGLFYALVLWVFSPRIGGWFFLGQASAVALLFWFGWQTFSLRRQVTPAMQQTPVPSVEAVKSNINEQKAKSLQERVGGLFKTVSGILPGKKEKSQTPTATQPVSTPPTVEDTSAATIGKTLTDAIDEDISSTQMNIPVSDTPVTIVDNTDTPTTTETASEATSTDAATTTQIPEATPPKPPSEEVVEVSENADAEEKTIPPVEEIAPDAVLAPPAEAPPEKIPPTDSPQT
ncbi:MAG: Ycf66 family protein [Rivularia sp. (in: cyanobacteria)]